jgi:hypothetical protein
MGHFGGGLFSPVGGGGGGGAGDIEAVAAGNGLTGGGTTGSVTLNVGAGTGITVNANDVQTDATVVAHLGTASVFTADQTFSTADAGTNTVTRAAIVRHTTSGTAAASFGAGVSLVAEDASDNADEAGSYDAFWTTATDGASQASVLSGRARVANAMTELYRIGGGTTASATDVDGFLSVGRVLLDSRGTDTAYFSHRDQTSTTAYALFHSAAGATRVNCTSGQTLSLMYGGTSRLQINATGIGFQGTVGVAAQTSGANLTNNVTSGGTDNTVDDWTIVDYATDAAAIRNAVYQLARKLKQVNDGLRTYGLFT